MLDTTRKLRAAEPDFEFVFYQEKKIQFPWLAILAAEYILFKFPKLTRVLSVLKILVHNIISRWYIAYTHSNLLDNAVIVLYFVFEWSTFSILLLCNVYISTVRELFRAEEDQYLIPYWIKRVSVMHAVLLAHAVDCL